MTPEEREAKARRREANLIISDLIADVATARAVALEEAGTLAYEALVAAASSLDVRGEVQMMRLCNLADTISDSIRALAPLPPGLVVVKKEDVEKVRDALMLAAHSMSWDAIDQPVRDALALLEWATK